MAGPSVTWDYDDTTISGLRFLGAYGQLAGDPVVRVSSLNGERIAGLHQSPAQLPPFDDELDEDLAVWGYFPDVEPYGDEYPHSFYFGSPIRITDPGSRGLVTGNNYADPEGTIWGFTVNGWVSRLVIDPPTDIADYFYPDPDGILLEGGNYAGGWDMAEDPLRETRAMIQGSPPARGDWRAVWQAETPFLFTSFYPTGRLQQEGETFLQGFTGYWSTATSPVVAYSFDASTFDLPVSDDTDTPTRRHSSGGVYSTEQGLPPAVEVSGTVTIFASSAPGLGIDYCLMRKVLKEDITYDVIEVGRITVAFALELANDPSPGTNRYNAKLMPTTSIGVGPGLDDTDLTYEYFILATDEGDPDPTEFGSGLGCTVWHKVPVAYLTRACAQAMLGGSGTVPGWMRLIPPQTP